MRGDRSIRAIAECVYNTGADTFRNLQVDKHSRPSRRING
jgi:hypothetical protein